MNTKTLATLATMLLLAGCMSAAQRQQEAELDHALAGLPEADQLECQMYANGAANHRDGILTEIARRYGNERLCLRSRLARYHQGPVVTDQGFLLR